ncbi:MAG: GlxA family transcriptional regulator [Motiliproteus sp.]
MRGERALLPVRLRPEPQAPFNRTSSDAVVPFKRSSEFRLTSGVRPHTVRGNVTEKKECTQEFAFLLLPGVTLTCLTAAINVLRLANQLSGAMLYRWTLLSHNGQPQMAEEGFEIAVHQSITCAEPSIIDKLVVCGGQRFHAPEVLRWLRRVGKSGSSIGALGQGSYLLARAGLLDGYRCTTHWNYLSSFQEEYPLLAVTSQLFVIDRSRFSCSGGSGVQDMMLHLVSMEQGEELAVAISEMQVCAMRLADEPQRAARLGYASPHLLEVIALMESNIEEPLRLQELADMTGISRRQLERLFRKYLNKQPSRYYMELRLNHGRRLLEQTNKSVLEVAVACGFANAPHFSKNVKDRFGSSPRLLSLLANKLF